VRLASDKLITNRNGSLFTAQHHQWAETVIGDENSLTFRPAVRVRRWGDEGSFFFRLPSLENVSPIRTADEINWLDTKNNVGLRVYGLTADTQNALGSMEIEILLLAKPDVATLALPIEMSGLTTHYQPSLLQWEIDRGNTRPEHVVDSYAFYHATRSPLHGEPGAAEKYKTGKAFHLYRLKAIDALGAEHWVTWRLDQAAQAMVIEFDRWFVDAVYPVSIDPTIGFSTEGTSVDPTDDFILANQHTTATAGDANPGTFYVYGSASTGTVSCLGGVYANGENPPISNAALQSVTANMMLTTTPGWRSAPITWTNIAASTNYWLAINNAPNGNTYYEATGIEGCAYKNTHSGTWLDPSPASWGFPDWDNRVSMYVDYAAAALTTPPRPTLSKMAVHRAANW
jgi:hypothetical protein